MPINISFPFGKLSWSFSLEGADVEFSVLPQKASGKVPAVPKKRLAGTKQSGTLEYRKPVLLKVCWSNAYSWMKGKKVTYKLKVDDSVLREKKKALTDSIAALFRRTITDLDSESPGTSRGRHGVLLLLLPEPTTHSIRQQSCHVRLQQRPKWSVSAMRWPMCRLN